MRKRKPSLSRKNYKFTAMLVCVLVASLVLPSALSLLARDTLNGIKEQVEEIAAREDAALRILEIVPDRSLAMVGYYFGGQEPMVIHEEDGSVLFDAWQEESKTWQSWQSGLEQYGSKEDREEYVTHLMERAAVEDTLKDLITVSGNIMPVSNVLTVSGNIMPASNVMTVSGQMALAALVSMEGEAPDAPIVLSSYKEVTKEQYEKSPGDYRQFEMDARERKGYFSHIGTDDYTGTRYDVKFVHHGAFADGNSGSFYQVAGAVQIPAELDSSWDTLLDENAYVKEGDRYVYCGKVADVGAVQEEEHSSALQPAELTEEEPVTEADGEQKPEENGKDNDITGPDDGTDTGNNGTGTDTETGTGGNGTITDTDTGKGGTSTNTDTGKGGTDTDTETGTDGNGSNSNTDTGNGADTGIGGTGTESNGNGTASAEPVDTARLEGERIWQLFSAPTAPAEYYYLQMERVAVPAVGDGKTYYTAEYEQNDSGKYYCEFTADDDIYADTVNTAAGTIYYEGGFTNDEWFKRYALDMEAEEFTSFQPEITTVTVDELNNMVLEPGFSFDSYDFISVKDGEFTDSDGNKKAGFLDGLDIDETTAQQLFESVMTSKTPIVFDSSIVFSDGTEGTGWVFHKKMQDGKPNLWKLGALFLQQMPERFLPEKGEDGTRPPFSWKDNPLVNWTDIEKGDGFTEDEDKNYVNQNIYSLYADSFVNREFESRIFNDAALEQAVTDANMEGFEDVLLEIESENMYREADVAYEGEFLPTDIKQSSVLRYIINYAYQRAAYLKTRINILDIEPCYPDEDSFPLTKKDVMKWLAEDSPITEADIAITTMTISEFIGKNEDINAKYDLVYIGTDTDKLNIDEKEGRTVFNDESMNGMVYFHVGDYRYTSALLGGQLNTEYYNSSKLYEYVKVRYSGLDLTKSKMQELVSYVEASYPVVLSDDFYTKDAQGNKVIDESYIDNSSYMYEFANKMLEEKHKNVFSRKMLGGEAGGKANVNLFSFYLNRPKLELVNTGVTSSSMGENGVYNISEQNGQYTLEYKFTISNVGAVSGDTRYQCELYVDVNADGKFSPLERLEDISLSGAEDAAADNLRAGVSYTLRRRVPDGYRGVLSWKVRISQVNNGNIRTSMTGYSKMTGMEPETIHVLQICRDELWWNGKTPWVSAGKGWWTQENNRRLNLESEFSNKESNYYKLLYGGKINGVEYSGITDDFNLDVKCVTISEFEKLYAEAEDKSSVLREYNMLILGFSDCYGNLTEEAINGPGGITEFIDSGKSVLFAHDTTSFINFDYQEYGYPDNSFNEESYGVVNRNGTRISNQNYQRYGTDYPWSYALNRFVRPLVGMDRYGINELSISKNEDGEVTSVSQTARSNMLKSGSGLTENSSGWGMLENTSHDIAWKPGTDRTETVAEVQGYTYSIIGFKDYDRSGYLNPPNVEGSNVKNTLLNYDFGKYFKGKNQLPDSPGGSVMDATRVNDGQITTYPYRLNDKFTVSSTHGQYYQLDMEADDDNDGESDLVVWYCLGESSGGKKNAYSISPNDVVNNYYIYNKGNVTYTGMGHDGRSSAYPKYVEEAKLFINTIIAAYTASIKPSEVKIIDERTEEKVNDIYNYFDVGNDIHLDDAESDYQKVYFTVRDTNFVKGSRSLSAVFYLEAADGNMKLTYNGEKYTVNRLEGMPVYVGDKDDEDGNDGIADASALTSGGIYYVRIPRALLEEGKTRQSFFVQSTSRINRYNEEIITTPVLDKADMVRLQLFELD